MEPTIVVKVGGSTLGQHDTALEDIAVLQKAGRKLIVVHGGGNAATEWLKLHGIASEFIGGLRVTGPEAIDVVVAVFAGLVNKQIVAGLNALGGRSVGISGADAGLLATRRLDPRLGFVGEVTRVDASILAVVQEGGFLPVVSCVGFWDEQPSKLMNINADTVAGEIAAAMGASHLVFLTDVANVRDGGGEAIEELRAAEVEGLISAGVASGGMVPKLRAGARAATAGTRSYIVDGRQSRALLEVLDGLAAGTKVVA